MPVVAQKRPEPSPAFEAREVVVLLLSPRKKHRIPSLAFAARERGGGGRCCLEGLPLSLMLDVDVDVVNDC